MIQEKDFLYRVPVKTAPITTPGGQIRNPEILVDVEGGEFMHGNILDANSTNKLINQSVKDAVDNKLIESGYVTKDLLEAETTRATEQENSLKTLIGAETGARTKGDEDLSSKIKAEQTRAEGKEKEISDKLAIVNGDSNTEGSFRKAIAGKQDKGCYITYSSESDNGYTVHWGLTSSEPIDVENGNGQKTSVYYTGINISNDQLKHRSQLSPSSLNLIDEQLKATIQYTVFGIRSSKYKNCLATSDGTFKPISDFALKTELPTVPTKTSQLTNDSSFITADYADDDSYGLSAKGLKFGMENNGQLTIDADGIRSDVGEGFSLNDTGIKFNGIGVEYGRSGITSTDFPDCIPTTNGTFIEQSKFVSSEVYNEKVIALEARIAALEAKHPEAAA